MANDPSDEHGPEPLVTSSTFPPRHVLTAGIAAACLLGAGAGLWARPGDADQRPAAPVAKYVAKPVPQSLEIVVDDGPAPIGKPIEVLPAGLVPATIAAAAPDLAPLAPPAALLKVQAVDAAAVEPDPEPVAAPEPPKVEAPPPKPRVEKVRVEKVRAAKKEAEPAKTAVDRKPAARPQVSKKAAATQVAKAEPPKAEPSAKAPSRVSKVRKVLAKVAKPKREKTAETKVAKAEPPKSKSKPKAKAPERETRLARAEKPPAKTVKVAKAANRCVSADPGAALVCADAALTAADRRLTRAYREAEAAGVPTWQLRQQQQRWLAARAAAAREAPWAVHDVYLARIAELQDMTRDVRDGY